VTLGLPKHRATLARFVGPFDRLGPNGSIIEAGPAFRRAAPSALIPDSFIQDLLARVDIVDVIERYVPLKKGGANYMARCPFHNEKTPSFTVSPSKQFYYCFGCGAKGSAIGFVMEYAGLGFREAVQELASGAGMKVPDDDVAVAGKPAGAAAAKGAADLYEIMAQAVDFYRAELKKSARAIEYLKGRGLTGEIAARFRIGYAPDAWTPLAQAFPDYQAKELVDCGLVKEGEDEDGNRVEKKRYDRFRDRIMFPIINPRGQVIGFGGRVLDKGEPKYLNSPETPIFEKGRELYGLPQARSAIREAGSVVVVEGYMDVVALAQLGVANCVAALGTATTPVHVQKLMKQADRIVFCFDGDTAGRKAAWRALENSLALLADDRLFSFMFLPQGEDPDSFVRKNGSDAFIEMQKKATPLSQFLLDHLTAGLDLGTPEGRSQLLHAAKPLVLQIPAPVLKLQLVKRLADLAQVSQQEIEKIYELRSHVARPAGPARVPRTPAPEPVHGLLHRIALNPVLASRLDLGLFDRDSEEGAAVYALVEWVKGMSGRPLTPAMLAEHFRGSAVEPLLASGKMDGIHDRFDEAEVMQDFDNLQSALRRKRNQAELDSLERKMRHSGLSAAEDARYLRLTREHHDLPRQEKGPTTP
jgi:DNA primase